MSNSVIDAIMQRKSVRGYKSDLITEEQTEILKKAALAAPSARNLQPLQFIFVKNQDILNEIELDFIENLKKENDTQMLANMGERKNNLFYGAPLVVFISANDAKYRMVDSGIAVENLAIAAKGLGLDSVIVAMSRRALLGTKEEYWKEKLKFPEGHSFVISIAIGAAAVAAEPHGLDEGKITEIN